MSGDILGVFLFGMDADDLGDWHALQTVNARNDDCVDRLGCILLRSHFRRTAGSDRLDEAA